MENIKLIFNAGQARARRVTVSGRSFIVAPLTMIVPGVLPGSKGPLYYPPDEVAKNYKVWNYTPLVVNHPFDHTGSPASARDPGILEKQGIGYIKGCFIDNRGKLKAEGWFDVEHTARVDRRILDSLTNNTPIELSTGLFCDNDEAPRGAVHNGRPYDYVARNYRPDHLAILPDQVGACSLNDGCGVLINHQRGEETVNGRDIPLLVNEHGWPVVNSDDVKRDEHGRFAGGPLAHQQIAALIPDLRTDTQKDQQASVKRLREEQLKKDQAKSSRSKKLAATAAKKAAAADDTPLKPHHEQTFSEFMKERGGDIGHDEEFGRELHARHITKAMSAGEHVPDHVLADHPGLKKLTTNLGSGNWHISKRREHADSLSAAADKKSEEVSDNDSELEAYTHHKDAAQAHRNAARTAANGAANGGTPDYEAAGYHGNKAQYHADKAKAHGDKCAMVGNDAGEEWITISGTHVKIDGSGNIIGGPEALKQLSARTKAAQHGPPKPDRSTGPTTPDKKEAGSGEQGGAAHKQKPSGRHELPMADMGALPVQKDEPKPDRKTSLPMAPSSWKTPLPMAGPAPASPASEPATSSPGGTPAGHTKTSLRSSVKDELHKAMGGADKLASEHGIHTVGDNKSGFHIHGTPEAMAKLSEHLKDKHDGNSRLLKLSEGIDSSHSINPPTPKPFPGSSNDDESGAAKAAASFKSGEIRASAGALSQHSPEDVAGAAADEHGAGIAPAGHPNDKQGSTASKPVSSDADLLHYAAEAHSATAFKRTKAVKKAGTDVRRIKEHVKAGDAHMAAAEAHEKAGNKAQAEVHLAAAIDHHERAARGDPTSRAGVTANRNSESYRKFAKRFLTVNSKLLLKGSIMERQQAIAYLTTNCRCWKGPDDREVLNSFSDYKLNQLVAALRSDKERQAVVNSVYQGMSQGNGVLTFNALPPAIQKAIQKKGDAVAKEGGDHDGDEDRMTDDDKDSDTASEPADVTKSPDAHDTSDPSMAGKTQPGQGKAPVGNHLTDAQWLAMAPPRIRELVSNQLEAEKKERISLINRIVANASPANRAKHVKALSNKSLAELRDQLELIAPAAAYAPDYSFAGGVQVGNSATDDQEDLLPIPVINWAEESQNQKRIAAR